MPGGMHICSFVQGLYRVRSPSGRTGLLFEDSNVFGPSKVHPRTGDPEMISDRLRWFWECWRCGRRHPIRFARAAIKAFISEIESN